MHIFRKSTLRSIGVSLVVAIALTGTAFSAEKKKTASKKTSAVSSPPANVVAKVNGVAITRAELDRATKFMLAQNQNQKELTAEEKKKADAAVLEQLISAELLYQAGKKLKIADVDSRIANQIKLGKSKFPSTAAYDKALKDSGLTEKELEEFARKEIYINNLIEQEIASKVTISDADAKKFYDENTDKFKQSESVQASHILIGVDPKLTADEKAKAKEKAEGLLKRAKAGEDFATLAKDNSTCPSKAQGGNLGYFGRGQMVPEFEKAAFALKSGEISDIVETKFGYHIIKVTDKKAAGTVAFDDAKNDIANYLKIQKIQQNISAFVDKLRKEAKVELVNS